MLYPTLNQPLMLLLLICTGIFCGLIFDAFNLLGKLVKNDKLAIHLFDFMAVIISFIMLFIVNLKFNYGQFRVYVLLVFLFGLILERGISIFLWTKLFKKCYSILARRKIGKSGQKEGN